MKRATFARRDVLRALGASGMIAPLVPRLAREAEAASPPRRLLLVYSPNGTIEDQFWPTGTETSFDFPAGGILEPLTPFRPDLILPRNIQRTNRFGGGGHQAVTSTIFTHAHMGPGTEYGFGFPTLPSIDQIIGKALPQQTLFRTLEVSVMPQTPDSSKGYICYGEGQQPIRSESNPKQLWAKLVGGAGGGAAVAAAAARRQSIIDLMKAELAALQRKVDRSDRFKIDGQLDAVRSIESRLQTPGPVATGGSCAPADPGQPLSGNDAVPAILKLQTDLLVSALACDLTRVATLQWNSGGGYITPRWVGVTRDHHGCSHDPSPAGIKDMVTINRWYAEQFAYLLGKLKAVREGNGTLLDNTLVVWANECQDGNTHLPDPAPVVMAGKLGGVYRTGRYLDFKKQNDWGQFLLTICRSMGVAIDRVGDYRYALPPAVITGLLA